MRPPGVAARAAGQGRTPGIGRVGDNVLWRAWTFVVGLPLGALGVLALQRTPTLQSLSGGAVAGGVALVLLASLLARWRDDDPARGRHLALGASSALLALPSGFAALLGLAPGAPALFFAALVLVALALLRRALRAGPAGGAAAIAGACGLWLVAGALGATALGGVVATLGAEPRFPTPEQAAAIYDLDARVAPAALPQCGPRPARVSVLAARGAHPRFGPDGGFLWFDAPGENGRRQIHRLERASGEVRCWTCGEEGENRRPSPGDSGSAVVFDTDRFASALAPANTELQLVSARGERPDAPSRRLTFHSGRDDHALFGPGSTRVVWSRQESGRHQVVSAGIQTGHGGVLLGAPGVLVEGGARWQAPLAWSADARSLVVARGQPLGVLDGLQIDLATGATLDLGTGVAGAAAAAFSADGGWLALALTRRGSALGLLPARLGFLLGPLTAALPDRAARFRGTQVHAGEPRVALAAFELGEDAGWGEPTGIALEPDATGFVLGQRRATPSGVEERLLEVVLDCGARSGS